MKVNPQLKKSDYENFTNHFSSLLTTHFPNVCFYGYGSFSEKSYVPGTSDIDGGIILPENFITDKKRIREISDLLKISLELFPIFPQLNLLDSGSNADGRFLSYTNSYTDWVKENGVVYSGPDLRDTLNGLNHKSGELSEIAFNFRRIRNSLLEASLNIDKSSNEEGNFSTSLEKAVRTLAALPKKLLILQNGRVIPKKSEAYQNLEDALPIPDSSTLKYAQKLLRSLKKFKQVLDNAPQSRDFYEQILTQFEQVLKTYVETFPEISEREARR